MKRDLPRFLDVPADDTAARNWMGKPRTAPAAEERQGRNDRPALFDPLPDSPDANDTGWNPDRSQTRQSGRRTSVLALAGVAILLAGWLLVSLIASVMESYR